MRNELLRGESVSPEFLRFTSLVERLRLDGVLDVAGNNEAGRGTDYFWYIHDYGDTHRVYLRELFGLIGISAKLDGSPIILPLREAIGRSNSAINIRTRSAYSVLQVFGSGIEIPPAHLDAGLVEPLETGLPQERRIITIYSSQKRPDNATVQVRFRDWWFCIDATDTHSKLAFRFLRTFIGMRLADPVGTRNAPVITIPVK